MADRLADLAGAVRTGAVSARALVELTLARIDQHAHLGAFVHVDAGGALALADEVDGRVAQGDDPGPLCGVPFGVKDLEDARGMPTTKGARWFAAAPPATGDALHVARLRAAGAIPVGKTATPPFGASGFTTSPVHGTARNPWDPTRTPGGSSGGSAAAVAAGLVPFCTASDGGGSIRGPAAFTGLPGLRPSYGRIATLGSTHVAQNAVDFALAPGVDDTALLLDVCAGPDRRDRTCLPAPGLSYQRATAHLHVGGLRAVLSPNFGVGPVDPEILDLVSAAFSSLCRAADLRPTEADTTLPWYFDTYSKIEGIDRWVDLPPGLWPERAAELDGLESGWRSGERARLPQLGAVYTERRRIEQIVAGWYDIVDVVVTPTVGVPAFAAEGPMPTAIGGKEVHPFVALAQPIVASLCNLPAMSVPVGLTSDGLPVGMQIVAAQHCEEVALRLAAIWERSTDWPELPLRGEGFLSPAGG